MKLLVDVDGHGRRISPSWDRGSSGSGFVYLREIRHRLCCVDFGDEFAYLFISVGPIGYVVVLA